MSSTAASHEVASEVAVRREEAVDDVGGFNLVCEGNCDFTARKRGKQKSPRVAPRSLIGSLTR